MKIQLDLFEQIKLKIDPNMKMADIIGDILNIGSDSTYRRLRGTKELSITELFKLCTHFNISIDDLCNISSENIAFKYTPLDFHELRVYEKYMANITDLYNTLLNTKNKEFIITAQDIPIFHFMPYPELIFFKLYAWNQCYMEEYVCFEDFMATLNKELLTKYYQQIYDAYLQVPSTELWSYHTVLPLINLLNYYVDINCFKDNQTILILCYQFIQLINTLEKWAKNGEKKIKGIKSNFSLYLSPIDMQNDFIITRKEQLKTMSIKLFTINAIFTNDEAILTETEKWINQIILKSSLLSGASERERLRFFQSIKNKINNIIERVENTNLI